MIKRTLTLTLVFVLLFSLLTAMPVEADEKGQISFGTTYSGYFTMQNKIDYYYFVLLEPGRVDLNVDMSIATYSPSIQCKDTSGKSVCSDLIFSVPYSKPFFLEAGAYYFEVSSGDSTGTYKLRADFTAAGINRIEPNNTLEAALQLSSGNTLKIPICTQELSPL